MKSVKVISPCEELHKIQTQKVTAKWLIIMGFDFHTAAKK